MLSPIGNSYGYYTSSPYATGHTAAAAHTALVNSNHDASLEVTAVSDVPEVFSNEETERVERTPEELTQDRRTAYEVMNSLTPRNAEHLNAPLEFMTKRPFEQSELQLPRKNENIPNALSSKHTSYESQQAAFSAFAYNNNGGFHAMT
ncbi:MAG: hypothetical protein IJW37_03435 [Lachnospiraceae bacterium]|nr:hypothetical protein [Lachnospiraceae bacterium]